MIRYLPALLVGTWLTACGSRAGTALPSPLELDVEGTLAAGASSAVKGTDMEVKFVTITEDSRCPTDSTCVWAGEVKVKLEVRLGNQAPKESEVLEGRSMLAEPYRLTVTRVLPEPVSTKKTTPSDYRISLIVVKI
jgi:hypothetical protein